MAISRFANPRMLAELCYLSFANHVIEPIVRGNSGAVDAVEPIVWGDRLSGCWVPSPPTLIRIPTISSCDSPPYLKPDSDLINKVGE